MLRRGRCRSRGRALESEVLGEVNIASGVGVTVAEVVPRSLGWLDVPS